RLPRRVRRDRISGGQGRRQRVHGGDRRRTEGIRGARERSVPWREDAAVDRDEVREPHRRLAPPRPVGRRKRAGRARRAPPEYVAPTYAYLASDLAKDVTGQILIAAG